MKRIVLSVLVAFLLPLFSYGQTNIVIDGQITGAETDWGTALSTSAGGPTKGFGDGHEINSIYVRGDSAYFYFFIGGNVQSGNGILLFIDSKLGGYTNGNFGRDGAPGGIATFNSGTTFDSIFEADYCLRISTDGSNYFWNLYTLSGTTGSGGGPDNYLGDTSNTNLAANPANNSTTRGFEFRINKSTLGYTAGLPALTSIQVFAAYISDGGFLSNQFLTRANSDQGNFGGGSVNFNSEPPNPILVSETLLPIELIDVAANVVNSNINLHWTTASEINNSHFEIERSNDGNSWTTIGQVSGAGTTTTAHHYTFIDHNPALGYNYYRLKQVDFDGAYDYSEIVSAALRGSGSLTMSPNPVNDILYLAPGTEIRIFDQLGRMVFSTLVSGNSIDISNLPSGLYMADLRNGSEQRTEQLIKQ